MYSLATATAWILFEAFGTVRFTVCLSSSERMEGIVCSFAEETVAALQAYYGQIPASLL